MSEPTRDAEILRQTTPIIKPDVTLWGMAKASLDTVQLTRKNPEMMTVWAQAVLAELKTSFPRELSNTAIEQSGRLPFYKALNWVAISLNDAVDMLPYAIQKEDAALAKNLYRELGESVRIAGIIIDRSDNPQLREEQRNILTNYQAETAVIEKSVVEKPLEEWTLTDALEYREVMNAISLVHIAGSLLSQEKLHGRLVPLNLQKMTPQALKEKYSWLIRQKPQTDVERKLCGLFDVVMAMQVEDDWIDKEDDKALELKTIASALDGVEEKHARVFPKEIQRIIDEYTSKAKAMGMTGAAVAGIVGPFPLFKKLQHMQRSHRMFGGQREHILTNLHFKEGNK